VINAGGGVNHSPILTSLGRHCKNEELGKTDVKIRLLFSISLTSFEPNDISTVTINTANLRVQKCAFFTLISAGRQRRII
jgi:hypothetical protein